MPSEHAIRGAFKEAAEDFFGRDLRIDERVYQAFSSRTNSRRSPTEMHVWRRLELALPAIDGLYDLLDVHFDRLPQSWPDQPQPLTEGAAGRSPGAAAKEWWARSFVATFGIADWRNRTADLTPAAWEVHRTGRLTVSHVVRAIFESGSWVYEEQTPRYTNLVLRHIAAEARIGTPERWSPNMAQFSATAVKSFNSLCSLDPSLGDQQFVIDYAKGGFQVRPFGVVGGYQLTDLSLPDGSLWIARSNVLQPLGVFTAEGLTELGDLITTEAREAEFQRFFERHPEFILALGDYVRIHPQLVIHEDDGRRLIPDFFLERIDSDLCDICDLKLPTTQLVRAQRSRVRFRDAVMEGVAQLAHYRDWFDDRANRESFRVKYGLAAFQPRVILVIGRRQSFYDDVQRISLEAGLPGWLQLKTYDDIVTRARQWRQLVSS